MLNTGPSDARGVATRERLVRAAIETLKTVGFAGASARAIAARAECNQALVFYHFGTVPKLLLAALEAVSEERMVQYRAAVEGVTGLADLVPVAASIYREDLASGHMTVLAELIAGSASTPGLAAEISRSLEPWTQFTEDVVRRLLPDQVGGLVDPADAAYGIVALYLGMEMLAHLEGGETPRAEALFSAAGRITGLLAALFPAPAP